VALFCNGHLIDLSVKREIAQPNAERKGGTSMKTTYLFALTIVGSAALGGLAVHGLHAQATPPVYSVAEINISNPDAYGKEYAPKMGALIKSHGGRIIAIGGTAGPGAKPITTLAGQPPKRLVITRFESMEQFQSWANDPNYKALREIGDKYATFQSFAVEGVQ
jgi:uncharacterized protein (DUF1330 family)